MGAGLNGDRRRGVPSPRVGLAGGGGGLRGVDIGALGDGDIDKGLDGVVLGGRLCGGGTRCGGGGGSGCVGWGVPAWVWVRVLVRAGLPVVPSYPWWFFGLCGAVLVLLLVVLVVVVLLRVVLTFGFRFWFGVGFRVGVRFEVEEDLVPEVRGHQCRVRGGSRCAAGVPGLPVWGSGGLRQPGVRLQLWLWPWPCG